MKTTSFRVMTAVPRVLSMVFIDIMVLCASSVNSADPWMEITSSLVASLMNSGAKPVCPGGCSGVVVNRLNGELMVKVVGYGLWRSSDQGGSWQRMDHHTISGRDETGWATSVDQNSPQRMASISLDGSAGWTIDGLNWKKPPMPA
jgi:hypothetical protein